MADKVTSKKYVGKKRLQRAKSVKIRTETKGFGFFKTALVLFFIALNFAVLLYFYLQFMMLFRYYLAVAFVLSLLTAVYVLSTDKNGQSKAVWIIIVLLGFTFGYFLYFLADENVFFFRAKKKFKHIFSESEKYLGAGDKADSCAEVRNNCRYLYSAGGFRTYTGTDIKYFPSGSQLFDDIISRLERAEKFVFIEFFIIADGVLFDRIFNVLARKVKEGVDVRVIYDDMGSHKTLSAKCKKRLRDSGIKIQPFNRLIPRFSVALNYRDHRKIVVVDGKTAYTGGCNLADEYINEKRMHGYWKDVGLRIDGPAADAFTVMFMRQWEYVSGEAVDYSPFLNLAKRTESGSAVIPYASGPEFGGQSIAKNAYANIIADAREKLYIMTPYFITDDTLADLLKNKALSGVDVRIILPEIPDKSYVYAVSRSNAERLISSGVKIYCMKNAFVHAKTVMSETQAAVGSVNIDLRSFYQQFECAVLTDDKAFLDDLRADFEYTISCSERLGGKNVKSNSFKHRIVAGILRIFAPLM